MKKRITAEDINVPGHADEVPGGFPVIVEPNPKTSRTYERWPDLLVNVYAPHMASPRPRVTSRGTFMPSDYRKYCDALSCSLAHARGIYEAKVGKWRSDLGMKLRIEVVAHKKRGDLDNIAKTIMDAGQLHRGEPEGAELWLNDSQVRDLHVFWVPLNEEEVLWENFTIEITSGV